MLKIFLNIIIKLVLGSLSRLAMSTIENLQNTDLAGPEKRKAAFETIKIEATKEGKNLRDSLINLAIEAGVNLLREKMEK